MFKKIGGSLKILKQKINRKINNIKELVALVIFGIFFGVSILIMLIFLCGSLLLSQYYDMTGKRVEETYYAKNSKDMNAEIELRLLNTITHSLTIKFIEDNYCNKTPISSPRILNNATIPSHETVIKDANLLAASAMGMLSPYYISRVRLYFIKELEAHLVSLIMDEIKIYVEMVYEKRQNSSYIDNLSKEEQVQSEMSVKVKSFLAEEGITNIEAQRLMQSYGDIPDTGLKEIANSESPSMSRDAKLVVNLKGIQTSLGVDSSVLNNLIMGLPIENPLDNIDFPELGF